MFVEIFVRRNRLTNMGGLHGVMDCLDGGEEVASDQRATALFSPSMIRGHPLLDDWPRDVMRTPNRSVIQRAAGLLKRSLSKTREPRPRLGSFSAALQRRRSRRPG